MGLDMYLEARKFIRKVDWQRTHNLPAGAEPIKTAEYQAILSGLPEGIDEYGDFGGAHISITVGYWRKVNAIHNWFVDNCGGGVDDCQPITVRQDQLIGLRALVSEVLENHDKAQDLLPTSEGFFFGTYEYDEWYFEGLEQTKLILDKALSLDENLFDFVYQASW